MPAWILEGRISGRAIVVFAANKATAQALADRHDALTRVPEWDIYEEQGEVPDAEWIQRGFYPLCAHCGELLWDDNMTVEDGMRCHKDCERWV